MSAFAFKAKQAPLQDLSNGSPTDPFTKQTPDGQDMIAGNCPTKPKAMVPVPSVPSAPPRKQQKGSNGLPVPVRTTVTSRSSKDIPTTSNMPGQILNTKSFDTSEKWYEEENRSDSNRSKQTDISNHFSSSNPTRDSPRLPSETWWPTFKPTPKNVTERKDSLLIYLQEGDVCFNGIGGLL